MFAYVFLAPVFLDGSIGPFRRKQSPISDATRCPTDIYTTFILQHPVALLPRIYQRL
jgi:hypothetical protein